MNLLLLIIDIQYMCIQLVLWTFILWQLLVIIYIMYGF